MKLLVLHTVHTMLVGILCVAQHDRYPLVALPIAGLVVALALVLCQQTAQQTRRAMIRAAKELRRRGVFAND